jgi:hypothetical protein
MLAWYTSDTPHVYKIPGHQNAPEMPLILQHPVFDYAAFAYTARHAVTRILQMISHVL